MSKSFLAHFFGGDDDGHVTERRGSEEEMRAAGRHYEETSQREGRSWSWSMWPEGEGEKEPDGERRKGSTYSPGTKVTRKQGLW